MVELLNMTSNAFMARCCNMKQKMDKFGVSAPVPSPEPRQKWSARFRELLSEDFAVQGVKESARLWKERKAAVQEIKQEGIPRKGKIAMAISATLDIALLYAAPFVLPIGIVLKSVTFFSAFMLTYMYCMVLPDMLSIIPFWQRRKQEQRIKGLISGIRKIQGRPDEKTELKFLEKIVELGALAGKLEDAEKNVSGMALSLNALNLVPSGKSLKSFGIVGGPAASQGEVKKVQEQIDSLARIEEDIIYCIFNINRLKPFEDYIEKGALVLPEDWEFRMLLIFERLLKSRSMDTSDLMKFIVPIYYIIPATKSSLNTLPKIITILEEAAKKEQLAGERDRINKELENAKARLIELKAS